MNTSFKRNVLIHHVLFYLRNPDSLEDRNTLLAGLKKMSVIPQINHFDIGIPAATNRTVIDRTYSFSWCCIFNSAEEEAAYQIHPLHDAFRNSCEALWEKVVVYDSITLA